MASSRDVPSAHPESTARPSAVTKSWTKSFSFKVAIRLAGICFLGCLTGFLLFDSPYWMSAIWAAMATVALFYETVRFVNLSERKLTAFLQSIKQNDFTVTFSENQKSDDYQLHLAFNQLSETYKDLRADKETQHQLLQTVVADAAVPLLCFDEVNDEVYLINDAAKELFQIPFLRKIESLRRMDATLPDFLRNIRDGEKASLKLLRDGKYVFLSVTSRHLLFKEKKLKLIGLIDVSSELAAREAEAWQKLLRVLTHEISNSAIPLSTLSSYITEIMTSAQAANRELSAEERKDVLESLKTIDQRSRSLKQFVANFKSVNQIPEPELTSIPAEELILEVGRLFSKDMEQQAIAFRTEAPERKYVTADRNLTMLVLINLMKNAMESMASMKEGKSIVIKVESAGSHFIQIHVMDSGCGIPGEDIEQIFVPFYSTKKGGSGIGLSIAHQIMQKQKGNLSVVSMPGKGSVFTASFLA